LYGATKLASEMMIQEYAELYGLRAIINRCGVIAGSGQFGRVDQGVFTLWVAHHFFRKPLTYAGFGGTGKQVRDLLHPADLCRLIRRQFAVVDRWTGESFNVGGGRNASTSLREMTSICQEVVGNKVMISEMKETSAVDIPLYISDHRKAAQAFDWQPSYTVQDIIEDILQWLRSNELVLKSIFT
jgi:CDP-paratose 2-epimerase